MIITMQSNANEADVQTVLTHLTGYGLTGHLSSEPDHKRICVVGERIPSTLSDKLNRLAGVQGTSRISVPYKLASREFHSQNTIVEVNGVQVGGQSCVVIAGPCSVESQDQILETARAAREAGATMLRGGAFKPRTSPYSWRGLGEAGLRLLALAREETGLPIVTEVMTIEEVPLVSHYADVLQVGARNMQNYQLLEAVGRTGMPVLLKRGLAATITEWLLSAEYILAQGNPNVMLCERGIRTFETATRNTLDLNAVAVSKHLSHLPVIADPSHGTGKRHLVEPLSLAALAAGADGLILEIHPDPDNALCDGDQSLNCEEFAALMPRLATLATALGREIAPAREQADQGMLAYQLPSPFRLNLVPDGVCQSQFALTSPL